MNQLNEKQIKGCLLISLRILQWCFFFLSLSSLIQNDCMVSLNIILIPTVILLFLLICDCKEGELVVFLIYNYFELNSEKESYLKKMSGTAIVFEQTISSLIFTYNILNYKEDFYWILAVLLNTLLEALIINIDIYMEKPIQKETIRTIGYVWFSLLFHPCYSILAFTSPVKYQYLTFLLVVLFILSHTRFMQEFESNSSLLAEYESDIWSKIMSVLRLLLVSFLPLPIRFTDNLQMYSLRDLMNQEAGNVGISFQIIFLMFHIFVDLVFNPFEQHSYLKTFLLVMVSSLVPTFKKVLIWLKFYIRNGPFTNKLLMSNFVEEGLNHEEINNKYIQLTPYHYSVLVIIHKSNSNKIFEQILYLLLDKQRSILLYHQDQNLIIEENKKIIKIRCFNKEIIEQILLMLYQRRYFGYEITINYPQLRYDLPNIREQLMNFYGIQRFQDLLTNFKFIWNSDEKIELVIHNMFEMYRFIALQKYAFQYMTCSPYQIMYDLYDNGDD